MFADLRSASRRPAVFTRGDDPPAPPVRASLAAGAGFKKPLSRSTRLRRRKRRHFQGRSLEPVLSAPEATPAVAPRRPAAVNRVICAFARRHGGQGVIRRSRGWSLPPPASGASGES